MDDLTLKFKEHLIDYDKTSSKELLRSLFNSDGDYTVINKIFFDALNDIGEEWNKGKLSLAQVYMSGVLCEELINDFFNLEDKKDVDSNIAIVTFSDYHILGKKILYSQISVCGYQIKDFGQISDNEKLVKRCINERIELLMISVLMLPSALKIKELRACFEREKYDIEIIVGGAPFVFNPLLYKEVGANATGKTPTDAMRYIDKWRENLKN